MYGSDIAISSPRRHCGASIEVRTAEKGKALEGVTPSGAVVWHDFAYGGSAATSSCPSIAFFCSNQHLDQWLDG